MLQAINELNPTVVHFSGHGSDTDEIIFQDLESGSDIHIWDFVKAKAGTILTKDIDVIVKT